MATANIQPIGDHILLQHCDTPLEEIKGGVIIPDRAQEKPQEATVIALGSGRREKDGSLTPFDVQIGDKVIVGKFSGTEVRCGEQQFMFVRQDEILAVLT